MKKHLRKVLLALFAISLSTTAGAQSLNDTYIKTMAPSKPTKKLHSNASRATMCGVDTIIYPYYKEIYFTAGNDSFFVDRMFGSTRTASQAYLNNDTISVKGVQFWGAAYTPSTAPTTLVAMAILYNVDATNKPTTRIDSTLVTITNNYNFYEAMFSVPQTVTGNFAVAIKNSVNDSIDVVINNAGNNWTVPDYSESLAWRRFGSGVWNSTVSFFGQDQEYMIFPIVQYEIDVNMTTTSNDTICEGDSVAFSNTSSPIMQNRMFNLYEFGEYWNADLDSTFLWVYGDGNYGYAMNGGNTYDTPGTYTPKLYGFQLGYYMFCMDSAWMTLEVMPTVNASFTVDGSGEPSFEFMSTSTGGMTYMWDFGDSTTATGDTVSHTYTANGAYTVTLITTGFCGSDTTTQTVNVVSINANAIKEDMVRSFYNVNDRSLVVDLGKNSGTIMIYDMLGNTVLNSSLASRNNRLSVSSLPEGTYIAKITSGSTTKTTRFVVLK